MGNVTFFIEAGKTKCENPECDKFIEGEDEEGVPVIFYCEEEGGEKTQHVFHERCIIQPFLRSYLQERARIFADLN